MCPNKRKLVLLINNSYLDSYYCQWTSHGLFVLPLDKTCCFISCFIWFGSCYHLFIISWGARKISHSGRLEQHSWRRMENLEAKILVCIWYWIRMIKSIEIGAILLVRWPTDTGERHDKKFVIALKKWKLTSNNYTSTSETEFEMRRQLHAWLPQVSAGN